MQHLGAEDYPVSFVNLPDLCGLVFESQKEKGGMKAAQIY
jgi:hypothetical protein